MGQEAGPGGPDCGSVEDGEREITERVERKVREGRGIGGDGGTEGQEARIEVEDDVDGEVEDDAGQCEEWLRLVERDTLSGEHRHCAVECVPRECSACC